MAGGHGGGEYKDLVVFLAAAGVVVPLFNRLKISPVLGFLAAGVLLGIHAGLCSAESGLAPGEATWITTRLAELLGWPCPQLPAEVAGVEGSG